MTARSDALERLDDYVRAFARADDDAYESDLFARALEGEAPEMVYLDSVAATLRMLGERGTSLLACSRLEAERIRAKYGARADWNVVTPDYVQRFVLSSDAELVITHIPLDLSEIDRVDIENYVEGYGLLKTFPDMIFERTDPGLYLCCEGSLARKAAAHPIVTKLIGYRNGEKTVLRETRSETSVAPV